jgi:hypothetical protein
MPKSWQPGEEKKFCRELKLGKTYYAVAEIERKGSPWVDPYRTRTIVFTDRLPLTGTPCTELGYSAATFLRLFGPVYDTRPEGVRLFEETAPQFPPNAAAANPGGFINVNF